MGAEHFRQEDSLCKGPGQERDGHLCSVLKTNLIRELLSFWEHFPLCVLGLELGFDVLERSLGGVRATQAVPALLSLIVSETMPVTSLRPCFSYH